MTQLLGPADRFEFDNEYRFSRFSLLTLFGKVLTHRLTAGNNPHNTIGKNYNGSHHHPNRRNPTGSKLLRRFIRANTSRSEFLKKDYALLTGLPYNHLREARSQAIKLPTAPAPKVEAPMILPADTPRKPRKPNLLERVVGKLFRRNNGRG